MESFVDPEAGLACAPATSNPYYDYAILSHSFDSFVRVSLAILLAFRCTCLLCCHGPLHSVLAHRTINQVGGSFEPCVRVFSCVLLSRTVRAMSALGRPERIWSPEPIPGVNLVSQGSKIGRL